MIAESTSSTRHPFVSLLGLFLWVALGMIIFTVLGIIACGVIFGFGDILNINKGVGSNINALKLVQLFSSIGTFIVPAFVFAKQESKDSFEYLNLNKRTDLLILISAVVIFFSFTPFIEWTIVQNSKMKLPGFLSDLEIWMRQKEDEMAVLTRQFLIMKSPSDLLINLLIIAIIPGIGEELLFRGCLQKILSKWTKNYHLGIWLAAVIFSAIHVQFYGFIPRMLLGALFGYLFHWGKNLVIPMIAHSINNGTAVIGAFILQKNGESLDKIDEQNSYPLYVAILSFIVGVGLLALFKSQLEKKSIGNQTGTDV
ncbi:CPBP family intramembrane glutamic endopeptidase [Desertivirga arenae]|uniref:CPBP family intramembrane glutamic endopeptidase n=1 Tax=Desertivirga arenae TaxID=2810309 RepID=UPI001A976ADE|nr:CPBP family intramembrane glutamic endopeptidase [Pedobacter sp. SYSU D00823]